MQPHCTERAGGKNENESQRRNCESTLGQARRACVIATDHFVELLGAQWLRQVEHEAGVAALAFVALGPVAWAGVLGQRMGRGVHHHRSTLPDVSREQHQRDPVREHPAE